MKKLLLVAFMLLAFVMTASAAVEQHALKADVPALTEGGAAGQCQLNYYNVCAGWVWYWTGWAPGDMAAMYWDIPTDCDSCEVGESVNWDLVAFYWAHCLPTYGYLVDHTTWEVDGGFCLNTPLETWTTDPVDGWNVFYPTVHPTTPLVGLSVTWVAGGYPHPYSENHPANYQAVLYCPGYFIDAGHTWYAGNGAPTYCLYDATAYGYAIMDDGMGPVDFIAQANFTCLTSATEDASWTGVKSLFR